MNDSPEVPVCRRLGGKVAIVTGGAGGIGKATIDRLAGEGASVVLFDAAQAAVDDCVAEFAEKGIKVTGMAVDITEEEIVDKAVADVAKQFGKIDIMICGAGVRPVGPLLDMNIDDWNLSLKVNLTGAMLCSRAAARIMLQAGNQGSIIIIGSINALRGVATLGAYNTSKAGTIGLLHTMAAEWGPHGIRCNGIAPAQVETPMILNDPIEWRRKREERIPLGRYAKTYEIANAVAFLASDDSSFVNGHTLCVDGGYNTFGIRP